MVGGLQVKHKIKFSSADIFRFFFFYRGCVIDTLTYPVKHPDDGRSTIAALRARPNRWILNLS